MFSRKSRGDQPAEGSGRAGRMAPAPGGRHAFGAPRSEASQPRPPADDGRSAHDQDRADHAKIARRLVRFPDLHVVVKDGTVYDTTGRMSAVGPLSGARAHVTVREPDPRRANLVSRALGQKQVSMIIPLEITVTVAGTVLTRTRDAHGGAADHIRSAKKQAAEFNDLARHWPS